MGNSTASGSNAVAMCDVSCRSRTGRRAGCRKQPHSQTLLPQPCVEATMLPRCRGSRGYCAGRSGETRRALAATGHPTIWISRAYRHEREHVGDYSAVQMFPSQECPSPSCDQRSHAQPHPDPLFAYVIPLHPCGRGQGGLKRARGAPRGFTYGICRWSPGRHAITLECIRRPVPPSRHVMRRPLETSMHGVATAGCRKSISSTRWMQAWWPP